MQICNVKYEMHFLKANMFFLKVFGLLCVSNVTVLTVSSLQGFSSHPFSFWSLFIFCLSDRQVWKPSSCRLQLIKIAEKRRKICCCWRLAGILEGPLQKDWHFQISTAFSKHLLRFRGKIGRSSLTFNKKVSNIVQRLKGSKSIFESCFLNNFSSRLCFIKYPFQVLLHRVVRGAKSMLQVPEMIIKTGSCISYWSWEWISWILWEKTHGPTSFGILRLGALQYLLFTILCIRKEKRSTTKIWESKNGARPEVKWKMEKKDWNFSTFSRTFGALFFLLETFFRNLKIDDERMLFSLRSSLYFVLKVRSLNA